jgi:DNA-binding PadR family transcriptional regulator
MKKGLVDGIEDETGEMVYFPTEKGRELNTKDI